MNKLPSESIRLLSSAQVITSPSSVVKELVENALDAGATTLDVKLEKFGLEKIEVRDNGCGIKQSDTEFMAQQYYTSKISKHEDLQMLETYGFRGEALGSLCQVADVCIITRTVKDSVAVSYTLDHEGKVCSTKPTHDGVGTTVIASNLFKNFPVRKQCFQTTKKGKEEVKRVEDILMAYGLIIPQVRIILRNNKNLLWQKNKSSDIKTAVADVFGIHVVNQFEYFEYCDNDLHVTVQCFVPKNDSDPQVMWRSSDERSFIFVNKRYVIWKELSQVLKKQCVLKDKETSSGKYPLCLVSVCLSSQDVDANLEPNKTKVIINHKEEILEIITKELSKIYNGNEVQTSQRETEETHGTRQLTGTELSTAVSLAVDLDRTSGIRAGEVSEVVSNQTTSSASYERLSDLDLTESSGEISANKECHTGNEGFIQQRNIDDHEPPRPNSNNFCEVAQKCASDEENNMVKGDHVLRQNDCALARKGNSFVQSKLTSGHCTTKENINENSASADSVPATTEKEDNLNRNCDLDELLSDFMNDSENLDDSLLDILATDQPNQEQWSRGRGLTDKNGKEIEPMKLLHPSMSLNKENEKSTTGLSNGKRKHNSDKDHADSRSDRPTKKNKKHSTISGQSFLTSVLHSPKTSCSTITRVTKTKEVSFSLSTLKQLAVGERSNVTARDDDIQLIKRLDPWGVWLVHKKRQLFVLNPYRIQELLLYKRLLATHVLPKEKLGKAIVLDESILGGSSRYSLLKELVIKNKQDVNVRICCDDERLVSNGFEITGRLDGESGEISMWLVKMNTTISYFGVSDLIEVLDLIRDNAAENGKKSLHDLASCRTRNVRMFLKDEVARISRSLPSRMTDMDIEELLKNMNEHLTENENSCVHNRPLLYQLSSY